MFEYLVPKNKMKYPYENKLWHFFLVVPIHLKDLEY